MKVSVYLASSTGNNTKFVEIANHLGVLLAKAGLEVIYGGANVGCMKALADGVVSENGTIIGVFPKGFKGKPEYEKKGIDVRRMDLTEMIYVADFSERKKIMEGISDCCIVLPGSWGTLDEMFDYMCGRALRFHSKPTFILNVDGFFNPMIDMFENVRENGFMSKDYMGDVRFFSDTESLVEAVIEYENNIKQ